jgi:hypothetical protein
MGDSDSDEDNKYLFSLIKTKRFEESEKLRKIKEAHSNEFDINPTEKSSRMTLLQTAQRKGFPTIVKYLEDKISENKALSNTKFNVGETSNSPNTLNDNKSVILSSINNANENKAFNQIKDPTTNVTSTSAETNPIQKSVNIPGDGSCLFWAVTLAFLFPVRHDSAEFERRFKKLFDPKCLSKFILFLFFNTVEAA